MNKSTDYKIEKKCPICEKDSTSKYHPFCSKRCADVDLNRWLTGVYKFETDESPEDLPISDEE